MQRSRSSCSAASGRYAEVAGRCGAHRMRSCWISCEPHEDHIDVVHPPRTQRFHQSLCTCDLCKPLSERTSRVSPHAIHVRKWTSCAQLTCSARRERYAAASSLCSCPISPTSLASKRPLRSTAVRRPAAPAPLRWQPVEARLSETDPSSSSHKRHCERVKRASGDSTHQFWP